MIILWTICSILVALGALSAVHKFGSIDKATQDFNNKHKESLSETAFLATLCILIALGPFVVSAWMVLFILNVIKRW